MHLQEVANSDCGIVGGAGTNVSTLPLAFGQESCMSALIADILEGHQKKNNGDVQGMMERKDKMLEMCGKIEIATVRGKGVTI
ncbi:hypothetical protein TL16_g02985 [Triparma laevis f. inornata]|nr:hypothetical protein TL16_g02985 [Triparma laevis f. inornata]